MEKKENGDKKNSRKIRGGGEEKALGGGRRVHTAV